MIPKEDKILYFIQLCPNCHAKIHAGLLKILGIIPSTKLPNKRIVIYEINGKKNIDIDIPESKFKQNSYKLYNLE